MNYKDMNYTLDKNDLKKIISIIEDISFNHFKYVNLTYFDNLKNISNEYLEIKDKNKHHFYFFYKDQNRKKDIKVFLFVNNFNDILKIKDDHLLYCLKEKQEVFLYRFENQKDIIRLEEEPDLTKQQLLVLSFFAFFLKNNNEFEIKNSSYIGEHCSFLCDLEDFQKEILRIDRILKTLIDNGKIKELKEKIKRLVFNEYLKDKKTIDDPKIIKEILEPFFKEESKKKEEVSNLKYIFIILVIFSLIIYKKFF